MSVCQLGTRMLLVLLLKGGPDVVAAAVAFLLQLARAKTGAAAVSTLSTRFFPHYTMSTYLNNRPRLAAAMMYCLMIRCESWNCTGLHCCRCIGAARAAVQMVKWDTRTSCSTEMECEQYL
eukprot:15774_5